MLCYFVSNLIDDTLSIGHIAYNSPWYQMARTEKVCVEMIIRRSQRPFELKGLGIFVCSLETYLRVHRKQFSFWALVNIFFKSRFQFFSRLFLADSKCRFVLHGVSSIECCLNCYMDNMN